MTSSKTDQGGASLLVIASCLVVIACIPMASCVAQLVQAHQIAARSADAAALAAAQNAGVDSGTACGDAQRVSHANATLLSTCDAESPQARVVVTRDVSGLLASVIPVVSATARAELEEAAP